MSTSLSLHPEVAEFLEAGAALERADDEQLEFDARRGWREDRSNVLFQRFGEPGPEVAAVEMHEVVAEGRTFRVRVYRPTGAARGAHLYVHGGGWLLGSVDELVVDATCRERAAAAQVVVVSVNYRLAPEHPFPAGLEDVYESLLWTVDNAQLLGIDPTRISIGGSSAGGNLCAALTLLLRERGGPSVCFQLLEVPALNLDVDAFTPEAIARAVDLDPASFPMGVAAYAQAEPASSALVSPLKAPDVTGLPRCHIIVAGRDPLREQGEAYAQRLTDAGVATTISCYDEAIHGSGYLTARWEVARRWRDEVQAVLSKVHGDVG